MTTPMQRMEIMLSTGQKPSYEDLEDVLAQSLQERNAFERSAHDMACWMSNLVTAHLCKDALQVKAILDEFIEKKVKIVRSVSKEVH